MKTLKRILAATDLSAPARHAVDRAYEIAALTGARYSVVHAVELATLDALVDWIGEGGGRIKEKIETQAADALRTQLAESRHAQGVAAEPRVIAGPALESILSEADALDAGLLVLGARGEDFLRHLMLGSTASRLLRRTSRYPILVVKQPPHEPYRRVLLPVDFSRASRNAVQTARLIAPKADLVLMHAFEVPFEGKLAFAGVEADVIEHYRAAMRELSMQKLRHLAESAGLALGSYTPLILHGDASQHIVSQEQERDADLIVIGKHGQSIAEELLLGSVTKHVLAESQCDVLVVAGDDSPTS